MKRFIIKTTLFFLPILLFASYSYILLSKAGELNSIQELKDKSTHEKSLIGIAYSDPIKPLKYQILKERNPEVIALGTSRVIQIRSLYFKDAANFYNAGRMVSRLNDIQALVENYPNQPPEVIILGLDQNFFSVEWDQLNRKGFKDFTDKKSKSSQWLRSSRTFAEDFISGKIETSRYFENDSLKTGFTALKYNEGFRPDGSYRYGRILLSETDEYGYHFKKTRSDINKGKGRFRPSGINPEAVKVFENLLEVCRAKKIKLHIFLPPFAHAIYQQLSKEENSHPYIFELYNTLLPICKGYDVPLYDFSDMKVLNANDFETIDGFHGSETAYLKIMMEMFSADEEASEVIDFEKARSYLKNAYSSRQLEKEIVEFNPKKPQTK